MRRIRFGQEKQNFSIRKYSLGAASVLIGTSLVFGLQEVKADEQFGETLANSLSPIHVEENSQVDETISLPKQVTDETKELVIQENKVESERVSDVLTRQTGEKYTSKSQPSSEKVSPEQALTTANQEVPIARSSFQEDQKNLVTEVKKLESDLAPEGKYTYVKETAVRNQPTQSAPIVFYAQPGDKVNYDKKLESDGHQWISYVSYSGTRRYVDLGKVTSSAPRAQSQISTSKPNPAPQTEVIASNGTYTFTQQVSVKNEAKAAAATQFTFEKGDKVNYDKKLESDGHQWISYVSYSGTRRYVDLGKVTSSAPRAQSQISTSKPNPAPQTEVIASQGTYTFTKQVSVKNEAKATAATQFTFEKGDKVNYDKKLESDGHQWISYVSYSGTRRYVDLGKVTSSAPSTPTAPTTPQTSQPTGQLTIQNQTSSGFDIEVTNVSDSNGIQAVKIPVWSDQNGQNDIVWYDAAKQANGNYKVSVSLANHKNEQGTYQAHLYYVENDGKLVGVAATQVKVESKQASTTPQSETLASNGTYTFTQQVSVKNEAKAAAATQFTFEKGDKVNYDKKLESDGHQWISYVSYSGTRRYVDLGKVTSSAPSAPAAPTTPQTSQPTGQLTIQNQTSSGFDIEVTNVSDSKGIKAVKIPVWSDQNGQNDIVWYDAAKQANGNYKVSVSLANHKNEQGTYQAHLYYVENDGKFVGVATTQVKVESKQASTTPQSETLASNGTYTFTQQVSVKNEAKATAATQFTFEKGEKVNYDKKLESDGHQWISYVSYSGTRRYVDLGKVTSSTPTAQSQISTSKPNPAPQTEVIASKGTYTFTQQVSVKNEAKAAAATQFTFEKGEKINYDRVIESDGYRWLSYTSYSGTQRFIQLID